MAITNLYDLTGRTAIITGSSRGIGKATAEQLAAHGANVVISSRKADACQEVADAINAEFASDSDSPRAISVPANISSKDELANLVAQSRKAFGPIDILVCNAASNPYYGPMAEIEDDVFRKILDNNILSNHWLIQMCAPDMVAKGKGSVIIVSSIGGMVGTDTLGAYNISKAADLQLARNYATEFGKQGINVNCIAPGLIKTDMARALWENPKLLSYMEKATPLGRIGEPNEIAGAAVFLASDASNFMTGQAMIIDGGTTITAGI
ncbi:SDR family NAD(P)-dependent oxidoreductase [Parasphingorhabdus sp. DH2-15]|uniref:SDR family NAD(P)-dependent oxidoreductase n=1 Tax=Parasphingorhabdus sp. DH2-15 TaxID=3444112 RepID=UPI003F685BEE